MELIEFNKITAEEWDYVVCHSDDGWAFSLASWLEMVSPIWNMENLSFAVRENGNLVAVMPLHWIPSEKRLSSGGWGHGGPSISASANRPGIWRACWDHVKEIARERKAVRITASISPITKTSLSNSWGINPLIESGFNDVSTHARVINLQQDTESLWFGLAKNARQNIKHAQSSGYKVQKCSWKDMLDHYYGVHVENYRRTGVLPHPRAYFDGIASQSGEHFVLWVGFDPSGAPIAFHNDARFGGASMYHTGCAQIAHLESGINYLLFWEAIRGAKEAGCEWYEAGEVFPLATAGKDKGLSDFKRKFGGELHRVFRGEIVLEGAGDLVPSAAPATEVMPKLRVLLHDWLYSTRNLVKFILGRRFTNWTGKILFRAHGLATKLRITGTNIQRTIAKPFFPQVAFIKPYWSQAEEEVGFREKSIDSEHAQAEFTSRFRKFLRPQNDAVLIPTGSGRIALELALRVLKKKFPNRTKVIIPTYGCKGIFDPIVRSGLVPVFVDVDYDLLLNADGAIANFSEDVLACVPVHLCGKQMDITYLRTEAVRHGIAIVEDYCQATGGEAFFQPSIIPPDFCIYSFGMGKNLMASAGGALVAYNFLEGVEQESKELQQEDILFARERFGFFHELYCSSRNSKLDPYRVFTARYFPYDNFVAMNPLDALIMAEQLDKLSAIIEKRQTHAGLILEKLDRFDGLFFTQMPVNHLYTKLSVRLRDREVFNKFALSMKRYGIELEGMYIPLHLRDFGAPFRQGPLRISETIYPLVINIPVRPNLMERELERIASAIESFGRKES